MTAVNAIIQLFLERTGNSKGIITTSYYPRRFKKTTGRFTPNATAFFKT